MRTASSRLVLGFFPADSGDPEGAFRAISKTAAQACLFCADGRTASSHDFCAHYGALRLAGEGLVIARAAADRAQETVQQIRAGRSAAVFVLRETAKGAGQREGRAGGARQRLLARLARNEQEFHGACGDLEESARLNHSLTAAAEWLLDNSYLVLTHAAEMRRHIPRHVSRAAARHGDSRLLELAQHLVQRTDGAITEANIAECLREDQGPAPLTMSELWLFPLMLRLALIERLADLATRVSRAQQIREIAYLWANRLAAAARTGDRELEQMIGRLETEPAVLTPYFAVSLTEQLQDEENALGPAQRWIEQRLGSPLSGVVQQEHTREAAERVSTANAFGSLRILSRIEFADILEQVSLVEAELRKDPGGIYARQDFETRDECRHVIEQIARHSGVSELGVARRAIELARLDPASHVAEYLLSSRVTELEMDTGMRLPLRTRVVRAVRRHASPLYVAWIVALTGCFTALAMAFAWEAGTRTPVRLAVLGLLALFPLSELAIQIVHALVISLLAPVKLPKMDFRAGIPAEHATLIVVPMMLTGEEGIRQEIEKLEVRFLANPDSNLWFSLLADFTDSPDPARRGDEALLDAARGGIESLNQRYPGRRFLLFHRPRVWSESEQRWIGRERKRGKLEDLNAFLCGERGSSLWAEGELPVPVRYVLTLDSDTQLPPGTARRLVETIAHPLNRVQIDRATHVRRSGYAVIQPRVSVALPEANATLFTRIFADAHGTDPYCKVVSDAHQDLFTEGIFHGKAIYDVRAFYTMLTDRFPPETLLSHDLIEGAHAGVALASDIELFETIPHNYSSFSKREHRWIRGDWQIAPWIFSRVPAPRGRESNPLSALNRWRILDNLRRSLVPVASLLLLVFGWLVSATPGVWSLVVALAIAIPAFAPLLDRWVRTLQGGAEGWHGAADQLIRGLVVVAFLPHQCWLAMDAIARVVYRSRVTRRNLLEWEPADASRSRGRRHASATLKRMIAISVASAILLLILGIKGAFLPSFVFLALWIASPALMVWLGRPRVRSALENQDQVYLRERARRTWRYFDDLVTEENHWLPPDNSQLALRVEVAQRTSPTNIGMWLASALAARDLGYLTPDELLERCSNSLATLARLERHEGHLLNWYDTRTLDPLNPRYVSTVDSGNLLASLWVLEQGCREMVDAPVLGSACPRGLSDTLAILTQVCRDDLALAAPLDELRRLLRGHTQPHRTIAHLRLARHPLEHVLEKLNPSGEKYYWARRLKSELDQWIAIANRYLAWMETLTLEPLEGQAKSIREQVLRGTPSLRELADEEWDPLKGIGGTAAWLERMEQERGEARARAKDTVKRFAQLAEDARNFAAGINMRILYDPRRRLFAVGHAVGGPAEFNSYYDLLASECRLASLAAIAKGDVPRDHWMALGRPRAASGGPILLSWTGTMFEYLMPLLYMRNFEGSLIERASADAVKLQMEHARREGLPWGVSECAYSALDQNQIYQYRAFGVPELALKRGMEETPVVAPYATMLALQVDSAAAIANLKRLEKMGLAGPMGFYESIDFSRESRQGEPGVTIYAYMAHHQGMSLVALANVLHRGVMQRRFHSQLRVRAFESLLFERVPVARARWEEIEPRHLPIHKAAREEPAERVWKEVTGAPRVHLNGNGRYTLVLTHSGGGFSRWNGFDVTRWRSDAALDPWGSFIYIRDAQSGVAWSAAAHPLASDWGTSSATFAADHAEYYRRVSGIETRMYVTVAPEDDVEIRRVLIANRSARKREIEFTSYAELALIAHRGDTAHPAFAKMFIETECPSEGVLIAHRRPRSPEEPGMWAAHVLLGAPGEVQFETDRERFLGRGNTPANPAALDRDLTRSIGAVLDPIFSLRSKIVVGARERREIAFLTIAAASREELMETIQKYRGAAAVARSFEMAWTRSQLELRYLGVQPGAAHRFHQLAGQLLYPSSRLRAGNRIARNRLGQAALWSYGISGDLPMLAVTISDPRDLAQVREMLLAHTYCRMLGFRFDLVVLDQEPASYDRPLREQLTRYIEAHSARECIDCAGGVFLRDWNAMPEMHRDLILASASIVLHASRGPLEQQLAASAEPAPSPAFISNGREAAEANLPLSDESEGFQASEYAIVLKDGEQTPTPWVNVMANPDFGTMVTESGFGFTWNRNSQSNRLTPWHNDAVADPQSEAIYLRDDDTGAIWSATPAPARDSGEYRTRHGQGYSIYEHNHGGLEQSLEVFVPQDSVKVCRLEIHNHSAERRRLTATYFAEWVLGSVREDQQLFVQTGCDGPTGAVTATQYWSGSTAGHVAFLASNPRAESWSGDRTSFFGRSGSRAKPSALGRVALDRRTGSGLDPAAALQVRIEMGPGERNQVTFLLGQAETIEAAREIIGRNIGASLDAVRERWDSLLGALQVRTPLPSIDVLLNRWLLYQALSCRFWGRSALYQSSGAFGFRDQLQDSLAFLYAAPHLTREHILRCAARQFSEGDVQHWWHPDTGVGVRTRCSDDLVWLPYAVAHYVEVTGDAAILEEPIAFLEGAPLKESEMERMFAAGPSAQSASLLDHCRRALDRASQTGEHGLPLIGSGDWNDGLNRVGIEGRGESVWLAWFLGATRQAFANLDPQRADEWRERASDLAHAVERACWDGGWYLRGFFDDGSPLGSHANEEARIDSLAQSWAVISGAGDLERAKIAMDSADRMLADDRKRLVKLFTPPFDHSRPHPGYIMGYPPGVRENGGQYTHGSLWLAMARARMGDGDRAVELLRMMSPLDRNPHQYRGEPYSVAADIYSAPGMEGRAGWTWYTGSAAWMYRIWIEEVLGFRLRGSALTIEPVIPHDWPGFEITYRYRSATYEIRVERHKQGLPACTIELVDDGRTHRVLVPLSGGTETAEAVEEVHSAREE